MKRIYKIVAFFLLILGLSVFVIVNMMNYQALDVEIESNVEQTYYGWYIDAKTSEERGNIVFYQGALVDAKAYIPLSEELASVGFNVYLLDSMLDLPILSTNLASEVIEKESIAQPILMGHSLGGVVASMVAENEIETKGLILLASYPSESIDLSDNDIQVISFVGSEDLVLAREKWEEAQKRLPKSTQFVSIEGGNHAQFGNYGKQAKDGDSMISTQEQQKEVVDAVSKNLK